jgi:LmbE family N-acetylglucosaminyl deacetylase
VLAGPYLQALRTCPITTVRELTGARPFVVLSPHPDDETLGTGGLIAEACANGTLVDVVIVTDGSGSHPHSKQYPRQALIDLRYSEVHQAGLALGLQADRMTFLDLPDTLAPKSGPLFEAAVQQIADLIRRSRAASLFFTWECDPHCDHEATAELAKAVGRMRPGLTLWAYPIWGWHIDANAETHRRPPKAFRIDISQYRDQKLKAIAAHASQMTGLINDDADGFRFDAKSLAPFLGQYEYFIEVPA